MKEPIFSHIHMSVETEHWKIGFIWTYQINTTTLTGKKCSIWLLNIAMENGPLINDL